MWTWQNEIGAFIRFLWPYNFLFPRPEYGVSNTFGMSFALVPPGTSMSVRAPAEKV